jgi:superfamily II DNA or RNA helicase
MIYIPRDYQKRLLNLCRQAIVDGHKSILLQGATGMGKSIVFAEIIRGGYEKGKTVLFLVHRRKIFKQVKKYMDSMNIPYGIVIGGEKHEDWHPVQLAMVQSAHRRLDTAYVSLQPADIIVIDEAHTSASETYLKVIERLQKNILIGLTATPVRKNGYGLKKAGYTILIQGKDYGASITDLTKQGHLVPIRYYAPVEPDTSDVPVQGGDYNLKILESRLLQGKVLDDIVPNWFKYSEKRKTFVFATGIKHSIAIRDMFLKAGVAAEHVDGNTPQEEQDAILDSFENGDTQVICSCDLFIEGVDIPSIGCVFIARSTKSIRIWMQMGGRGMRPFPGKKDMILIDHSGSFAEHGPFHEINDWKLDSSHKMTNPSQAARKARNSKPIECPLCTNIYTGQLKCPQCGNIPTKAQFGKDIEYVDGILGEIVLSTGKAKVHVPTMAEKKDWYQQAKNYAFAKGKDDKWISAMFKACYNGWPPYSFKNLPIKETTAEVSSYLDKKRQDFARKKSYAQRKAATP